MLNMAGKAPVKFAIVLTIAVTASLVKPVWTSEATLVTYPSSKHVSLYAGRPFEITCKGESDDDRFFSEMKWLNPKEEALPEGNPGVMKVLWNTLKLKFRAPQTSDSGVYKCVALYDNKQPLQTKVTITFSDREPGFESDYANVVAKEGSRVEALCTAIGEPPLTYLWYNERKEPISFLFDSPIFVSRSTAGSILNIKEAKTTDAGVYNCSAKSSFGLASKLFNVTVFPISDDTSSIKSIRAVKITTNSVLFDIVTSGSADSVEVKFVESQNSTEYQAKWKQGDAYEIKDLIPSGLYSFRFRTIPSDGVWTKVYKVTLLPDAPDVIIQRLESNSVRLSWFLTIGDVMRETIDKYTLTYYTLQISKGTDWIPSKCAVTIEVPYCAGRSYTLSGLYADTYYEMQLRAHTASGFGEPYKQKFRLQQT